MKAILHIGTEKTGTTAVQQFLAANRSELLNQGIAFPSRLGGSNHRFLPMAAYNPERRDDGTVQQGIRTDADLRSFQARITQVLREEIRANEVDCVIFSSEHLHSRLTTDREIHRLLSILESVGLSEITVVVYLRDPLEVCVSLYSTAIKTGSTLVAPPEPDHPYWNNLCDHRSTMTRWSSVFGGDAVIPRLFEPDCLINGSVVDDFAAQAGIKGISYVHSSQTNQSISMFGLKVLRRINEIFPKYKDGNVNSQRTGLVRLFEQHMSAGSRWVLSEEAARKYESSFRESNEWLRSEYFPERKKLFAEKLCADLRGIDYELEVEGIAQLIAALWQESNALK